ncbi:hypothetical protein BCR34DRAFT_590424 [Clohesyomyces aquaticus]|uniref:Jacalin-type lectin domain-containing protein n=1 Tax=Clohesyomyces aquaticus TaxID=1231657 RepID=A0A1Y1ZAI9_9PLEO|nr:hypothetical protein BCR34DRAFT_590424 [Clohesyomyces aquaticus]
MTMQVGSGTKLFECKSDIGSYAGEPQDLAIGILIGAFGSSGSDINSLGLMFLHGSVGEAQIVDMKFPDSLEDMNHQKKGMDMVTLKPQTFKNGGREGSGNQTFPFSSRETRQNSRKFTKTDSKTFGTSVPLKVGGKVPIPEVMEISTELTTTSMSGHYATDYINIVNIKLASGQEFKIEKPSHVEYMGVTQALVESKIVPIAELPGDGKGTINVGKRRVDFKAKCMSRKLL